MAESRMSTRDLFARASLAVVAVVAVGLVWQARQQPGAPISDRSQVVEGMQSVEVAPSSSQLIAAKSMSPDTDQVLICDNYDGLLPMDLDEMWVEFDVPESGAVLVSLSAQTSNSKAGKGDYWGLMVDDEVVAGGLVGVGEQRHRKTARFLVTELEPGTEVRMHWAHRSDEGGTANIHVGPDHGPALFEVWST